MARADQITAAVITVSTRCARGDVPDTSGQRLVHLLADWGYPNATQAVITDGAAPVAAAIREAVDAGARLVVTSGGTGISPTDRTPEGTEQVLETHLPGIPEAIRAAGAAQVPHAALSRGLAGTRGQAFILNLPGSPSAATDGMAVAGPLLEHILDQLTGGNHD